MVLVFSIAVAFMPVAVTLRQAKIRRCTRQVESCCQLHYGRRLPHESDGRIVFARVPESERMSNLVPTNVRAFELIFATCSVRVDMVEICALPLAAPQARHRVLATSSCWLKWLSDRAGAPTWSFMYRTAQVFLHSVANRYG